MVTVDYNRCSKNKQLDPTAKCNNLAQEEEKQEKEQEGYYLGKLYNELYVKTEACCTVLRQ